MTRIPSRFKSPRPLIERAIEARCAWTKAEYAHAWRDAEACRVLARAIAYDIGWEQVARGERTVFVSSLLSDIFELRGAVLCGFEDGRQALQKLRAEAV